MEYMQRPLKDYLDDLWAKKPAPGGGSVAALAGALGASLLGMCVNFTVGKPEYKAHNSDLEEILKASTYLKERFEELVDLDVRAYSKLRDALKMKPKREILEELYKESANIPIQICVLSYEGMKACPVVADWGNRNLISDVGIAAELFEASFYSGKLNVDINLNYIEDKKFIEDTKKDLEPLGKNIESLKKSVIAKVKDILYEKY